MRLHFPILAISIAAVIFSSCDINPIDHHGRTVLEGTWRGYEISDTTAVVQLDISGINYNYTIGNVKYYAGTFALDDSVIPHHMDAYVSISVNAQYVGETALSIYQLTADTLLIAGNEPGVATRPSSFLPSTGTAIFRLTRVSRFQRYNGDTISLTVNGPETPLNLGPSDTVWVSFQAVEGTIYRFPISGSRRLTTGLVVDSLGRLGSTVYLYDNFRWTGQKTAKYYIQITTDSAYVDTDTFSIGVHSLPAQMSGEEGSFLCWNNFHLARFDASSGALTRIGNSKDFFPILQYGSDGTLYGVCSDLCVIDPVADKITVIGNFVHNGRYLQMGSGAISGNDVLYVRPLSSDSIFTVDLSTAELTFVCSSKSNGDFAIDTRNNLYIAHIALSRVDLSTFAETSIGSLRKTQRNIAFTSASQLMGMGYDSLYTIDVNNATVKSRLILGDSNIDCFVKERPPVKMLARKRVGTVPHRTMEELEAMRKRHLEARPREVPSNQ